MSVKAKESFSYADCLHILEVSLPNAVPQYQLNANPLGEEKPRARSEKACSSWH